MKNILIILTLIVLVVLGFSLGLVLDVSVPEKQQIKETVIPLPVDFLSSPILEKLYANTEGMVVAKTGDSLALEKDGLRVEIFVEEATGLTRFDQKTPEGPKEIHFEEIKIGDYLKGGVSFIVNPSSSVGMSKPRKSGDIIGQRFMVVRE